MKFFFLLILLSSCTGYHVETSTFLTNKTLEIQNIPGAQGGSLMIALAQSLAKRPNLDVVAKKGDIQLEVLLCEDGQEVIGYEYDRTGVSGAIINRLRPNEGKIVLSAKIKLIDTLKKDPLCHSVTITTRQDFDYSNFDTLQDLSFVNSAGQRQRILEFSQGQLDTQQGASLVAKKLAMQALAEKIADFIVTL